MRLISFEDVARLAMEAGRVRPFAVENAEEQALEAYEALQQFMPALGDAGFSAEEIFWSRYYWFMRFRHLRVARSGFDAGLDQQAFQILEAPFPACEPDWSLAEIVETAALAGLVAPKGK